MEAVEMLKAARKRHGLSQVRLASLSGIPRRTIENWKSGARECPDYVIRLLVYWMDHELDAKLKRAAKRLLYQ